MAIFPFTKIWFGVELEALRPVGATYGGEPFDRLPAIAPENLDGSFGYLSPELVAQLDGAVPDYVAKTFKPTQQADIFRPSPKWEAKLQAIQASLPAHLILPAPLRKFMAAPVAQQQVPSCTASYFDLPKQALPFTWLGEQGYLFHFYRDQQDCLFWYYYVRESGERCILASAIPFAEPGITASLAEDEIREEVFYTAASFEEFIYRTWIENVLWFNLEEGEEPDAATTAHCQAYLASYRAASA
jgi:hypothetical protein